MTRIKSIAVAMAIVATALNSGLAVESASANASSAASSAAQPLGRVHGMGVVQSVRRPGHRDTTRLVPGIKRPGLRATGLRTESMTRSAHRSSRRT
jgi:hypothetical protein